MRSETACQDISYCWRNDVGDDSDFLRRLPGDCSAFSNGRNAMPRLHHGGIPSLRLPAGAQLLCRLSLPTASPHNVCTISTPAERKDDGASEIPSDDGSETPRDDASEVPRETDAVDVELQSAVKKHCLQSPLQRHRRRILCFFALFEVPFIVWQLRDLSIDNLPPSFLPWDHPLQRAYLDNADFSTSPLDVFDTIHIFWGLKADALDMEGVYRLRNKGFVGRPKLDRAFRFDGDAQAHMLRACMVLRASDLVPLSADFTGDQTLQKAVQCWPEAFEAFVAGKGMPFPVDNASLAEEMLLDWIGEETALNNARGFELAQDIGFVRAEAGEIAGQDDGGRKLLFVKLRASSTIPATFPPPYEQLNSQYTSWEELVDEINAGAPPSASHAVQVIVSLPGSQASDLSNKWVQVSMHTAYVTLTGTGLAIGLGSLPTSAATLNAISQSICDCDLLPTLGHPWRSGLHARLWLEDWDD